MILNRTFSSGGGGGRGGLESVVGTNYGAKLFWNLNNYANCDEDIQGWGKNSLRWRNLIVDMERVQSLTSYSSRFCCSILATFLQVTRKRQAEIPNKG